MSKSKGNVLYADDLVEEFGVDAIRFYLLHEIPFAADGNISRELLIERINTELANTLGNLVQRTIKMADKYFDSKIENKKVEEEIDKKYVEEINNLDALVDKKIEELHIADALTVIFDLFRTSNKYIDENTPWVLAKEEDKKDRLETVLYNLLEAIRVGAIYLEPFMPDTSSSILKQLNNDRKEPKYLADNEYNLGEATILFKRIDK